MKIKKNQNLRKTTKSKYKNKKFNIKIIKLITKSPQNNKLTP